MPCGHRSHGHSIGRNAHNLKRFGSIAAPSHWFLPCAEARKRSARSHDVGQEKSSNRIHANNATHMMAMPPTWGNTDGRVCLVSYQQRSRTRLAWGRGGSIGIAKKNRARKGSKQANEHHRLISLSTHMQGSCRMLRRPLQSKEQSSTTRLCSHPRRSCFTRRRSAENTLEHVSSFSAVHLPLPVSGAYGSSKKTQK